MVPIPNCQVITPRPRTRVTIILSDMDSTQGSQLPPVQRPFFTAPLVILRIAQTNICMRGYTMSSSGRRQAQALDYETAISMGSLVQELGALLCGWVAAPG